MEELKVGDRVQAHVMHLCTPLLVIGTVKSFTDVYVELSDGRVVSKALTTKI